MMRTVLGTFLAGAALAACAGEDPEDGGRPTIVVTTNILGDVVQELVGDAAEVDVVLPAGADPHDFLASMRQAEAMSEADLLVVNGAGFEGGLESVIDAAADAGTEVFVATDHVDLLDGDPHFWTDPRRMAEVVEALAGTLPSAPGAGTYAAELRALDAAIADDLRRVPADRRVLVTNHEVLTYFADRYAFEVVGTVLPLSTRAEPSATAIDELAAMIRDAGVPAIFVESSSRADLAEALADEVGDIEVVELFAESLGEPGSEADTYAGMQRTNAERIAAALS
jgi:zinc/manganese transport system substrate-binding protein